MMLLTLTPGQTRQLRTRTPMLMRTRVPKTPKPQTPMPPPIPMRTLTLMPIKRQMWQRPRTISRRRRA